MRKGVKPFVNAIVNPKIIKILVYIMKSRVRRTYKNRRTRKSCTYRRKTRKSCTCNRKTCNRHSLRGG